MLNGHQMGDSTIEGWYQWRLDNWGTKWEPMWSALMNDPDDDCYLEIDFDTAWAPPVPFFRGLADKFPEAEITLLYYEGGCDFSGATVWTKGIPTEYQRDPGMSHHEFLSGGWNWEIAGADEVDDEDDEDEDSEPEEEEGYDEDDEDEDEHGLTFAELAGDENDVPASEIEEPLPSPQEVAQRLYMGSVIPPVVDWTEEQEEKDELSWRDA